MNEVQVKLPKRIQLDIIKHSIKKGTMSALKDPVDWAVALTSGAFTGVKEDDRNKGFTVAAMLMAKSIIVKSVEETVEGFEEAKEMYEKILKEENNE